jgi:DUF4097 and DUF4098 domain-containing protein YvlB
MAQEKWLVEDGPKTIETGAIRALKVALIGGRVDVVGHDEPGARVEIHSVAGKDLKVSIDGDTLEIDHPQFGWDNLLDSLKRFTGKASAEVSVHVPRDVVLKLGVVTANGLVSGLTADVSASTVSGDLVIDGLCGELSINSVSGEIAVRDHVGRVTARTIGGDVTVGGEIDRLAVDSVGGNVFVDLRGAADELRVNTVGGNVTVRMPAGLPVQYRISTAVGKVQLDDTSYAGVRGQFTARHGQLDQHWLDFKANTVGGDITALHAADAPQPASAEPSPEPAADDPATRP